MERNQPREKARIYLSRTFEAAHPEIAQDLQRIGREVFGESFDFSFAEHIETSDGAAADGAYNPMTRIAYIALQMDEAAMTHTLWHEGLHHLRNAGAFTGLNGEPTAQWHTLEREAVNTWRKRYQIDQRYDASAPEAILNEEAIAEALADYQTRGHENDFNSTLRTALAHIMRFFRRVGNALRSRGFSTWEDVFEDITTGHAGARTDETRRAELDRYLKAAWHASPYRFAEFNSKKIGSGVGSQAYGYGFYFAERRLVAATYRDHIQDRLDITSPDDIATLYQVDLAPAEDEYLLYDEPIDAQSDKVKAALQRIYPNWRARGEYERLRSIGATGGDILHQLEDQNIASWVRPDAGRKRAAKIMLSKGIRGIKYLDEASRGRKREPTYNHIIFDDADITVEYVEFQRKATHSLSGPRPITESQAMAINTDHEAHMSVSPTGHIQPMTANTDTETYAREASQLLELAAITADAENFPAAADKFREARQAVSFAVPAVDNEPSPNISAHAALRQLYRANYPPNPAPSFSNASETYELQAHRVLLRASHAAYRGDQMETAEILHGAALATYTAMSDADQQSVVNADTPYYINTGRTILSNDAHSPMRIDGVEWPSVQHYFQAEKLGAVRGPEAEQLWESIRTAPTADRASSIGATVPRVSDWEDREVGVVAEALCAKFRPGSDAAEALLATGDRPLVNNTPAFGPANQDTKGTRDGYWATNHDHRGVNALGRMLENCRDELHAGRPPTIDALTTKIPAWPFHAGDPAPRRAWEYANALRRHSLLRQSWTQSYRTPRAEVDNKTACTRLAELGEATARAAKRFTANFDRYGPHLAQVRISRADLDTRQRALSVEASHSVHRTQEHAMGAIQV